MPDNKETKDYFEEFAELNKDHPAIQAYGCSVDMRTRGRNVFIFMKHGQLKRREFKFPQNRPEPQ